MLEGDDTRGGVFVLFLRPHPGEFRQLMCPHPGEFAHFLKRNANARGLARGGGGGMGTGGIDSCINADKVTWACNTYNATRSKTKKLTFSLEATKFCLVLRSTPAVPTQTVFFFFGWKNPFTFPTKNCALMRVDFLSR